MNPIMKIVIDEKIPYLQEALEGMGYDVLAKPGVEIGREDVADASALFVRTRTRCDAALLEGSSVRFIGTATIGYDHIDAAYCHSKGIEWKSAAGCNAGAVLQYVQSVIYEWAPCVKGLSLGIVGVGEIGSRVAEWASSAGMIVYKNDPPKAAKGVPGLVPLAEIADKCDIITFHTTLERGGEYPSFHLADKDFFNSLKKCRLLINASRGEVVDNVALLDALKCGKVGDIALDVWENEPYIDNELLAKAFVATPHIAGYSAEGKMNATRIVLDAFLDFVGNATGRCALQLQEPVNKVVTAASEREALLSLYSPLSDTALLKEKPADFEDIRNNYELRREPASYEFVLK